MKNKKGKFAHITLSITVRERMFGYPRKEGGWKEWVRIRIYKLRSYYDL